VSYLASQEKMAMLLAQWLGYLRNGLDVANPLPDALAAFAAEHSQRIAEAHQICRSIR
jgi:hypothetical protein